MARFLICNFFLLFWIVMEAMAGSEPMMAGGLGSTQQSDDQVAPLVESLKPQILQKICALPENQGKPENCPPSDAKIQILGYKSQVVAGTNYFVSLLINGKSYHARLFEQSWTNKKEVTKVKAVQQNAEIGYF